MGRGAQGSAGVTRVPPDKPVGWWRCPRSAGGTENPKNSCRSRAVSGDLARIQLLRPGRKWLLETALLRGLWIPRPQGETDRLAWSPGSGWPPPGCGRRVQGYPPCLSLGTCPGRPMWCPEVVLTLRCLGNPRVFGETGGQICGSEGGRGPWSWPSVSTLGFWGPGGTGHWNDSLPQRTNPGSEPPGGGRHH